MFYNDINSSYSNISCNMSDTESIDTQVSAKTLLQDDDVNMESENMVFNPYNSLNKRLH